MKKQTFSPLLFLAALGAGGISVIPFALLQYTFPHGAGLIKIADLQHASMGFFENIFFRSLEGIMIFFVLVHVILSIMFFKQLLSFVKGDGYEDFINNPLKNSAILAPFISIAMTMNAMIGPVRYFIEPMSSSLQEFMIPALSVLMVIAILLLRMEIKLLKTSFEKSFDMSKVTFGWLLHPFALGMVTVTATGIAAMAKDPNVAHTAAFLAFVLGSMGMFLLVVKTIAIFQKHFASKDGLGEKQFMPSFLIVVPNVTLYAISAFRIGHYLEKQFHFHLDSYFVLVMTIAFAFETWFLIFGIVLLKDYFKNDYFKKEYYASQWGLICPFVAYAVLGSFVFNVFVPSPIFYTLVLSSMLIAIILYLDLLQRHLGCRKGSKEEMICE